MSQILHLENNCLEIKGATKIISSTQNQAVVETTDNSIVIAGSEIEVKKLNLDDGEVVFGGKFSSLKFGTLSGNKQPPLKRIFR